MGLLFHFENYNHCLLLALIHSKSLSLVVIRCHSWYHSLSFDATLICLFIKDHEEVLLSFPTCISFFRFFVS